MSQTVKDLVIGSDAEFEDRGERQLKGVPGTWRLYAVTGSPATPAERHTGGRSVIVLA